MEPTYRAELDAARDVMEAHARESFGRVVYSHKTHEKCADILLGRLSSIKIWQIILSSITTAGFLGAILGTGRAGAVVGIVVSTILLVLTAYTKNYDLGELAQKHRQAAADLWLVREQYLSLIADMRIGGQTLEELASRRDTLLADLHAVYAGAPSTNAGAYKKAQEALQRYQEMSFTEAELDNLLPQALRRGTTRESSLG